MLRGDSPDGPITITTIDGERQMPDITQLSVAGLYERFGIVEGSQLLDNMLDGRAVQPFMLRACATSQLIVLTCAAAHREQAVVEMARWLDANAAKAMAGMEVDPRAELAAATRHAPLLAVLAADRRSSSVRRSVASNQHLPEPLQRQLLEDRDVDVRRMVITNKGTSRSVLQMLVAGDDPAHVALLSLRDTLPDDAVRFMLDRATRRAQAGEDAGGDYSDALIRLLRRAEDDHAQACVDAWVPCPLEWVQRAVATTPLAGAAHLRKLAASDEPYGMLTRRSAESTLKRMTAGRV